MLLGEAVTPLMMAFAVIVVATVAVGRRMPIGRAGGESALFQAKR